ncbi:MAG: pirin family protein [Myxococcota bacterium]
MEESLRRLDPVLSVRRLGAPPWPTIDPFLFCVHHVDHYPAGNDALGPAASLAGRELGMDFAGKDGWRMYHGRTVPGFPQHPHRGFETITIARRGYIDHADSLGATARFGAGDVQWMTAGAGIVHAEMFPLLNRSEPNPAELFQIWLNLPAKSKMVDPHFTMLWREQIAGAVVESAGGRTCFRYIAGAPSREQVAPPPDSWASDPQSELVVWTASFEDGASARLPPVSSGVRRVIYVVEGEVQVGEAQVGEIRASAPSMMEVWEGELDVRAGAAGAEILVLGGRPIAEPVVQHGPFVMNTADEIRQAMVDYQRTGFGGWPWPASDPVHDRDAGRFAVHQDGRREEPS